MTTKPLISLHNTSGIGVIISYSSGVLYLNQVGGLSCLQLSAEGVYVPLVEETIEQEWMLLNHFTSPKWSGGCANGIEDEDAYVIDKILKLSIYTRFITVDRSRLLNSCEAWVYVNVATQPEERPSGYSGAEGVGTTDSGKTMLDADYDLPVISYPFYGFGQCSGILTWSNSD